MLWSDFHSLVAVVELSPTIKRAHSEGRREHLSKRASVLHGAVHLVELDLLRGDERLPMTGDRPTGDGYAIVSNARRRPIADVWPVSLRERLPRIRVPPQRRAGPAGTAHRSLTDVRAPWEKRPWPGYVFALPASSSSTVG